MKKRMNVLMAMGLAATMIMSPVAAFAEETAASDGAKWTEEETADGWMKVTNEDGATLGYSKDSGVTIIEQDGYAFKDLDQVASWMYMRTGVRMLPLELRILPPR